jgi:hypothetical protein
MTPPTYNADQSDVSYLSSQCTYSTMTSAMGCETGRLPKVAVAAFIMALLNIGFVAEGAILLIN